MPVNVSSLLPVLMARDTLLALLAVTYTTLALSFSVPSVLYAPSPSAALNVTPALFLVPSVMLLKAKPVRSWAVAVSSAVSAASAVSSVPSLFTGTTFMVYFPAFMPTMSARP